MTTRDHSPAGKSADREIVITRAFDAPRDLVFEAWTNPKHLPHWWGPRGFTNTTQEIDIRHGGVWRYIMHGPDGVDYNNRIVFDEIVKPERLAYTHGSDEQPDQFRVTVNFSEQGGKTTLTLRMVFPSAEECNKVKQYGAVEGGNQTLDRLSEHLTKMNQEKTPNASSSSPELVITRVLNAPRALVWKVFTESEHLAHWWGPKEFAITVAKLDLRPGGIFHYCMHLPNGSKIWGKFVYRELTPPERLVFINSFADEHGNTVRNPWSPVWPLEISNTVTFSESDGKTTLTLRGQPINATAEEQKTFEEWRESMQKGFAGTFEKLTEYLAKLTGGNNQ